MKTLLLAFSKNLLKALLVFNCLLGNLVQPASAQVLTVPAAEPNRQELLADQLVSQGLAFFQKGNFEQAATAWQRASDWYADAGRLAERIDTLVQLSEAYQALGQQRNALQVLHTAETLVDTTTDKSRIAAVKGSLGKAYWLIGDMDKSRGQLESSIVLARAIGDAKGAAISLNNLGNLLASQGHYKDAQIYYQESSKLARQVADEILLAKVLINTARAALLLKDSPMAKGLLDAALAQTRGLSNSHEKIYNLVAIGQLSRRIPEAKAREQFAHKIFSEAVTSADALGDDRALAYALGYQGQLYEEEQRYPEAMNFTRRAVFAAQQANAPEILYRWQWQLGRLLRAEGNMPGAIMAYQQAVSNLQSVRPDLSASYPDRTMNFRQAIEPVFFELADLLLKSASPLPDSPQKQAILQEARKTVEQLKTAEVTDYFQDDCVIALQSRITPIDRLPPKTAVFYPILLPDRTELLLSFPDGIRQYARPISRETLTQAVREFRKTLEDRTKDKYLPHAQKLYSWLISPLEADLKARQIETLVVVPDGPLRTIPMAALHDGQGFLVSQFALVTTPGLTLTDLRPIQRTDTRLMLSGLTEAVQGFPALKAVSQELDAIHELHGGTVLADQNFLITNIQQALSTTPYSIVHIASHGQFTGDVNNTFLLTYDDRLTMDRLENLMGLSQYRTQPVELLTLSACQTAAGDDRAALGLAGIAVKAGSRSAVATLWAINDPASAELLSAFYRELQNPALSKAKALQQAQLALMAVPAYRRPFYWSPFLLIGSWL